MEATTNMYGSNLFTWESSKDLTHHMNMRKLSLEGMNDYYTPHPLTESVFHPWKNLRNREEDMWTSKKIM